MNNLGNVKNSLFKTEYHLFLLITLYVISVITTAVYFYKTTQNPETELSMFNLFIVLAMGMWLLNALFKIEAIKERSHELNGDELRPCPLCKSTNVTHYHSVDYYDFILCTDCGISLSKDDLKLGNTGLIDTWNQKMTNDDKHNELLRRLEQARVREAEKAVTASIPKDLLETMRKANEEFKAKGGCPSCGSKRIAVHYGNCPELENDVY